MTNPDSWEEAMAGWTPDQIKCRAWRQHCWIDYTVKLRSRMYHVTQVCSRCELQRKCVINSRGQVVELWKVDYKDTGYLVNGLGRMDEEARDLMRVSAVGGLRVVKRQRKKAS